MAKAMGQNQNLSSQEEYHRIMENAQLTLAASRALVDRLDRLGFPRVDLPKPRAMQHNGKYRLHPGIYLGASLASQPGDKEP